MYFVMMGDKDKEMEELQSKYDELLQTYESQKSQQDLPLYSSERKKEEQIEEDQAEDETEQMVEEQLDEDDMQDDPDEDVDEV